MILEIPKIGEFVLYLYAEGLAIETIAEVLGLTHDDVTYIIRKGGQEWVPELAATWSVK